MAYGSKKTSDGKEIVADDSRVLPQVGIVDNCTVKGVFELNDDKTVASITFVQPNGAEVTHKEWLNDDATAQDDTNRRVKHIATKFIGQQAYDAIPEADSFEDFFNKVNAAITGKISEKFRMLFHYNNKGYVTVPRYPNFIESMSVNPTKITISNYVASKLTKPAAPKADPEMQVTTDDLPF
jgi:DNA primase catalytic subunit